MNTTASAGRPALCTCACVLAAALAACGDPVSSGPQTSLSPKPPFDVAGEMTQDKVDRFAWDMFIALNWPANKDGTPDRSKQIGEGRDHDVVWQHWMSVANIFLPNGRKPTWGTHRELRLKHISKVPQLEQFVQPELEGPLIDQNGDYARFDVLVNRSMFDYIVEHELYHERGQANAEEISFPAASQRKHGAVIVKATWKIVGRNDDRTRFHVVKAQIQTGNSRAEQEVALVGLHITAKTESAPQWIWATFEHADNCPTSGGKKQDHYSFHDPRSAAKPNQKAREPWDPARKGVPTQVVRMTAVPYATGKINGEYQARLRAVDEGSVWQHYMLVGAQWPRNPTGENPRPEPEVLANTTMETYIQESSSCIGCHKDARTKVPNPTTGQTISADYTFILNFAAGD